MYCNKQLVQLREIGTGLRELGYRLVALSPDSPETLKPYLKEKDPGFLLLSDHEMAASRALGIAYRVDDRMNGLLMTFKIDIAAASGRNHRFLPVPSVFFVDPKSTVQFQYVNPVYQNRLSPGVILAAARAGLGK